MKFTVLKIACCSVTFELDNHEIYQVKESYDVFLNGEFFFVRKEMSLRYSI